eukprot:9466145-Pyramimonas_sp.AAC.3
MRGIRPVRGAGGSEAAATPRKVPRIEIRLILSTTGFLPQWGHLNSPRAVFLVEAVEHTSALPTTHYRLGTNCVPSEGPPRHACGGEDLPAGDSHEELLPHEVVGDGEEP